MRLAAEQEHALEAFEAKLADEGAPRGVVGRREVARLFERHILDSLRALGGVRARDRSAYDLGSGGGLPGIPVAIARPELRVGLVERRANRASFLRTVLRELSLGNAYVVAGAIEALDAPVDVCFARALAPLDRSWALASPLLAPGGRLIYFAGARFDRADVAAIAPPAHVRILGAAAVASGGPLVIMSRP